MHTNQVAIPIFGDQVSNAAEVETLKIGVNVAYKTMTEEGLLTSIRTVLKDDGYKKRIEELSDVLMDQIDK